jgi:hypothetical protein
MGLIDRFQALWRRGQPQASTTTQLPPPPRPSALAKLIGDETDRRIVVAECAAMYRHDPRARGIIRTFAADAVRGGFELTVEGPRAEEAKRLADEMLTRINFWGLINEWVRLTLRDGDSFLEVVADGAGNLVQVGRKPSLEMQRLSDEFDQFADPARAYAWSDSLWPSWAPGQALPPGAVTFADWQMVHARWDHDADSRYGYPMFGSARSQFKRMKEGELDISIRRKTRAGMKYVHSLKDASEADIESYRMRNQAALNEPFAAVADFFSSRDTTISAIQGDATLSDIEDVLHHIRTWWQASSVPMSLLGYGQDLNRDVLEEQKAQYAETRQEASAWVATEFVAPLLERQWLLAGIWPDSLTWNAAWQQKDALDAAKLEQLAKALTTIKAAGILTPETLLRLFSRFVPDFDADMEIEALKAAQPDEINRMADMAGLDDEEDPDNTGDNNDLGDGNGDNSQPG